MSAPEPSKTVRPKPGERIWSRAFTVAPLAVLATGEEEALRSPARCARASESSPPAVPEDLLL